MDPRIAGPEQWLLMTQALNSLVLFVILMINTAISFMVAHGVIPSLVTTGDAPGSVSRFRPILYTVVVLSLLAAAFAFARAITLSFTLIDQIYPRLTI